MDVKQQEAEELNRAAMWLGEHNSGHTLMDDGRCCGQPPARPLAEICEAGNQDCNVTAASALPDDDKLAQLNAIKARVNSVAAGAGRAAVAKIVGVIQQLLDSADTSDDAPK